MFFGFTKCNPRNRFREHLSLSLPLSSRYPPSSVYIDMAIEDCNLLGNNMGYLFRGGQSEGRLSMLALFVSFVFFAVGEG